MFSANDASLEEVDGSEKCRGRIAEGRVSFVTRDLAKPRKGLDLRPHRCNFEKAWYRSMSPYIHSLCCLTLLAVTFRKARDMQVAGELRLFLLFPCADWAPLLYP